MTNKLQICLFMLSVILVSATYANEAEDAKFSSLAEQIWQFHLQSSPLSASYYGVDNAPDKMPNLSPETLSSNHQTRLQQLKRLDSIQESNLSDQNRINLQVLRHRLANMVDEYHFNAHQVPLTAEGGFHTSLGFLPRSTRLNTKQDIKHYLARLSQFPKYFQQQIRWMEQGLASGNSQPKVVLQGFEHSIDGFLVDDVKDSLFYQPLTQELSFLTKEEKQLLQQDAQRVIQQSVLPAYQNFRDFMVKRYIPNARNTIGVSKTPNGTSFYQNRARHYTTTDMSADEIHQLGLKEVARIRLEMQSIIEQVEFDGSFSEFLHFLRTDPQFYAKTADELLMKASYIAKKMDAQLPKFFRHLPRTPYGVAPVPEHIAPKYTTGRYVGPAKATDPGYYWVNTYALDRRPLYELEALTLHEAVPGHHLQNALTREMEDTPQYRSAYYMSAFGEGWGLYSEYLGLEAGFYQDPYSNFGRLTYEMWRACRLVVDTGMHVKGWSRQRALDFMKDNTALSEHNITTEIDRYISWPAQALSYKIGELKIKALRQKSDRALGAKFDIRDFHFEVLKNGSVPLSYLEQVIDRYIQAQQ